MDASGLIVGTNSYVTVAEAETVLSECLGVETWDAATDDNKRRALITATRAIDSLRLIGRRVVYDQALEFPRAIYRGASGDIGYGDPNYPDDVSLLALTSVIEAGPWDIQTAVPDSVLDACCLEAVARLKPDSRGDLRAQGVTALSLGKLSETYGGKRSGLMSGEALTLMRQFIATSVAMQ